MKFYSFLKLFSQIKSIILIEKRKGGEKNEDRVLSAGYGLRRKYRV